MTTEIENIYNFSIEQLSEEELKNYNKIDSKFSASERFQLSTLSQTIPAVFAINSSSNLYTMEFPEGLPQTLTKLKQGGYSTAIQDPVTKEFLGSASAFKISSALIIGMSAMAFITGQYFLTEINKELTVINQKADKILEFLYGDKKAELLSEISFINYAYQNYSSIMENQYHISATISSIQESRKVAMKDIEFYLSDLDSIVNEDINLLNKIENISDKAIQINKCIELSIQLYIASTTLEVYYSQNSNKSFLDFLENDLLLYIERCDKRIIAAFNILKTKLHDNKSPLPIQSQSKQALEKTIDEFLEMKHNETTASKQKNIHKNLYALNSIRKFVISSNGELYVKGV